MLIKILGPGCKNCTNLEKEVRNALAEMDLAAQVEKIEDWDQIMDHNVLMTPGLIINDKLKVFGRVPKKNEIIKWIKEEIK